MILNFLKALRGWLTEHWGLKLVSLLLAIGFWFYALGEEMVEVTRYIPLRIEMETGERKFSVSKRTTESLYVRLRAPRGLLSVLSTGEVSAYHKIEGLKRTGDYSFRVTSADIKLPSSNIRVANILPEVVSVVIDETIFKKVTIEPDFVGEPAYGYKILKDKVELDPNAVLIEGPKEKLELIDVVKTEPIELVGRTRSFRMMVRLIPEVNTRLTSEGIVDIFVPVREEFSEQAFDQVPVKPLGLPGAGLYTSIDTDKISFSLKGPKSELDRLASNGILAYVDVSGLKKGDYELPATFILSDTVSLKGDTPKVKLRVDKVR